MGEGADLMLDGIVCQECGTYIEDNEVPGYPRTGPCCSKVKRAKNSLNSKPTTGANAIKGVEHFLSKKDLKGDDWNLVCAKYCRPTLGTDTSKQERCDFIQKDFGKFVKWFRKEYK